MPIYTYQIGDGDEATINALSYSEIIWNVANLQQAIARATTITKDRPASARENTVRLLEEVDGDPRVVWVRPVETVRNAPAIAS